MFKFAILIFALIARAAAKPGLIGAPLSYHAHAAGIVAAPAPIVTATSNQVIARNYNGIATAPIVAPVAAPVLARTIAAPVAAVHATPLMAKYAASPLTYAAPLAYSVPLTYAAAAGPAPFVW